MLWRLHRTSGANCDVNKASCTLAGGINAGNVCNILMQTRADFIDVMTGVESSPGEKDAESLSRLLEAVQPFKDLPIYDKSTGKAGSNLLNY